MSAQREELLQLVEELPETEVPAMLDNVHRHLREGSKQILASGLVRRRGGQ